MKASLLFGFVSLALLPLCAEELTLAVNKVHTDTVTDDQTFAITDAPTLAPNLPPVLTATLSFTYPSETPDISEVANEKLAIACDTDGRILVADGTAWKKTEVFVEEYAELPVSAAGKFDGDTLKFDVTLGSGETAKRVEVTAPTSGTTLTELTLAGEGSAKDITLAIVNTAILPAPEGGTQNAGQVAEYVNWMDKQSEAFAEGGALADASDAELADAFAMNVGGKPKLEISAIDTDARTITVKGYYTQGETEKDAPLNAINGILYITWSETLTGNAKMTTEKISIDTTTGIATVKLPTDAKFVKATVSLVAPDTTETTSL